MNKSVLFSGAAAGILLLSACSTHYQVASVERSRILIDSVYDAHPNEQALAFLAPYKHVVDSVMSPVMGHLARDIKGYRPESALSNLLSDILVWIARKDFNEDVDLGIYNMGGIRASLSKGAVTYGDILEVAPFENKICFLTLTGDKLTQLFEEMASVYGEGVSHGVELLISQDKKLLSAKLHGKAIDPKAKYRIATIDYLAQGNDKLYAFKSKLDFVSPQDERNDTRYLICDYFKTMEANGVVVDAQIEGRIIIEGYENK